MKIAAWNLNHRTGFTTYLPAAAKAIGSLAVDVLVLTEYFPNTDKKTFSQDCHKTFVADLATCGFQFSLLSPETREKANRVLIVAKQPLETDPLPVPDCDEQLPANVLAVRFPVTGLRLLGVRVPYYETKELPRVIDSWSWLENSAAALKGSPAVIIGDLNVSLTSKERRGGDAFRRILASGWVRAEPATGASFYGKDGVSTAIDHALCSPSLRISSAEYETATKDSVFAGSDGALSDHAVLVVEVIGK